MFGLFKQKRKQQTELDFFRQFFQADHEHFAKIYFPILIYPELPKVPRNLNWRERQQYMIDNLISEAFEKDFETEYANFEGQRFEIITKLKSGDINETKRDELVYQFLDSQAKTFLSVHELTQSDQKWGDFNVFEQLHDYTPSDILKLTLEIIDSAFPESKVIWKRFTDESSSFDLKDLLKVIDDIHPLFHLDTIYDENRYWELIQPEESPFLVIGTNSGILFDRLEKGNLEIERIKN